LSSLAVAAAQHLAVAVVAVAIALMFLAQQAAAVLLPNRFCICQRILRSPLLSVAVVLVADQHRALTLCSE
jgi:predicted tellurium resistance membrane protein TerC